MEDARKETKDIPEKYYFVDDNWILCFDNGYVPSDYNEKFAISVAQIVNGILEFGYYVVGDGIYKTTKKGENKFDRILIRKSKI